jgi:RND family efflux transporter MFP subunit
MRACPESGLAVRVLPRHGLVILFACLVAFATGNACRRTVPAAGPAETPTFDVTSWTDRTELFMEYPPLVAGTSIRFAVHLTRLADFTALNAGRPHIELTPEAGGTAVTIPGTEPLRPGAFRVEGRMPAAGVYRWALVVEAPGLSDRHDLGTVTVFADAARGIEAAGAQAPEDPAAITYLKEQQWTNPFATARVQESDLRTALRVPAEIQPVTGGEAVVAAPAAGRFRADNLVSIGAMVSAGRVLGFLEPRLAEGDDRATLAAAASETRVAADAARAELARAETLVAEKAVPARRVEDARRALAVADARQRSAEARLNQRDEALRTGGGTAAENAFTLRAPLSGRVAEVSATLGASYEGGAPLFRIVRTDEVELQVLIPPVDVPRTADIAAVALEMPGRDAPLPLRFHHIHHSGVVDPQTHVLTVQIEVDNPRGELLIGQSGTAVLYGTSSTRMLAVPAEAVLMEAGRPYVFVQVGGERFARRFVDVAVRDGGLVGLRGGIKAGERVVTRGSYDVQLASAAKGLPAEGHVH